MKKHPPASAEGFLLKGDPRSEAGVTCKARGATSLVPVVIRLVRAFHRHADVVGLGLGEGRQMNAEFFEVEACDFFVEDLRERVHDAAFVLDAGDSLSIFLRNLSWPVQRRDFSFLTTFRVVPATWVADAHKGNAVLH